jgi:pimeloyl-ACP methyl ester carboxylesterase
MKLVGTLSHAADDDRFLAIASVFGTLDVEVFAKTLKALGAHDAEPYVARIKAPTLVVAGEIDRVTPATLSQSMAARMPHAELVVVRGATHYAAVEFPEYVGLRVERFLDAHRVG